MNAILLAGGKSTRMGFDKAFLKLNGEALIKKQLKQLAVILGNIIIVTNNQQKAAIFDEMAKEYGTKVKVILDIIKECGPMGGIYSGLIASDSQYNFIIACDMPFINTDLIEYMQGEAVGYDIVVPKIEDNYEPLYCIYSKDCIKYIEILIEKKIFTLRELFPLAKVRQIEENEAIGVCDRKPEFANINTINELNKYGNVI